MQGSQRTTGLVNSVRTNGWRRWLPWAAWLAAGIAVFVFSPACLFSGPGGSSEPRSDVALPTGLQGEAQPTAIEQAVEREEGESLDVTQPAVPVNGGAGAELAEAREPTPTPKAEPDEAADGVEEPAPPQVEAEAPPQQVESSRPEPQPPAEQGEMPQEAPASPSSPPEEPAAPTAVAEEPPASSCPARSMSGFAVALFDAINDERAQQGLPALAAHGCVAHIAQLRASDMAIRGYFSHSSPDGETAFSLMDGAGVSYGWAGENLATNTNADAETVAVAIRTLMESEAHRANILSGNFTHLGVGAAVDMSGAKYYTMIFISQP